MGNSATHTDRLIPAQEARNLIGVKTTKFYSIVKAGQIKLIRNGRRSFVRASAVTAYIDALESEVG